MCIFLLLLSLILAIAFQSKDSDLVFYINVFSDLGISSRYQSYSSQIEHQMFPFTYRFMFSIGCAPVQCYRNQPADFTISLIGNLMACIGVA